MCDVTEEWNMYGLFLNTVMLSVMYLLNKPKIIFHDRISFSAPLRRIKVFRLDIWGTYLLADYLVRIVRI